MANAGHGTQIVKVLPNHSYQLDQEALETVLLQEEIRDLPLVVVSVAGAYRGGKSFLLNFFIRYLSATKSSQIDGSWIGETSEPLVGFNWRGGVERTTSGILLWSKPFVTTLSSGEKVAVLLMDTQGTFDSSSTVRDNSTVFALSTLLSSVQIYNLSRNIQENDLQYLQLFTTYGKMVNEKKHVGKPFQTLEFLVRDWPYHYDYAYGAEGGRQFLRQRLQITPDQPQELQDLRLHIRSSFDNVLCYLMPHPGIQAMHPNFKGEINDIENEFNFYLKQLVSSLFSTDKLTPKTINGQKVTAGELYSYFKVYTALFNSDQIPNPRTIVQATVEASLLSAYNEARKIYDDGMTKDCGTNQPALPTVAIEELHQKHLMAARTALNNKRTMASQLEVDKNVEKLTKELNDRLPQYEQSNMAKLQVVMKDATAIYEEKILNIHRDLPLCLHPNDLENLQKEAVLASMEYYDGHVKNVEKKPDNKRVELVQNFDNRYIQLKITNDINNRDAVKEIKNKYWQFMETQSLDPPLSDVDFKKAHESGLNHALVVLQGRRNRYSSYSNDIFKNELEEQINYIYGQLQLINHSKIEQAKMKEELEKRRVEQEELNNQLEKVKEEQMRTANELEVNRVNQEIARIEQDRQRLEIERIRIEQENQRPRHGNSDAIIGLVTDMANSVLCKFF